MINFLTVKRKADSDDLYYEEHEGYIMPCDLSAYKDKEAGYWVISDSSTGVLVSKGFKKYADLNFIYDDSRTMERLKEVRKKESYKKLQESYDKAYAEHFGEKL